MMLPRQFLKPCTSSALVHPQLTNLSKYKKRELTSVIILLHRILNSALIRLVKPLRRQPATRGAEALVVHGVLQGIILPAEDVVAVLAVAGSVRQKG